MNTENTTVTHRLPSGLEIVVTTPVQTDSEGEIYGCTDELAMNYNVMATVDNGTCVYLAAPNEGE